MTDYYRYTEDHQERELWLIFQNFNIKQVNLFFGYAFVIHVSSYTFEKTCLVQCLIKSYTVHDIKVSCFRLNDITKIGANKIIIHEKYY